MEIQANKKSSRKCGKCFPSYRMYIILIVCLFVFFFFFFFPVMSNQRIGGENLGGFSLEKKRINMILNALIVLAKNVF
jgi:ATP-dependent Zn protease